ncbi:hypothetical protein [Terrisporobacter sp.]
MKFNKSFNNLKDDLSNLLKIMLVSERINSQRCLNEDLDTTKTIIDHKEDKEFTEEEIDNLLKEAKRLLDTMLVSERINSQRCLNQDLDTTKTIIDHVEKVENNKSDLSLRDKELELQKVVNEIKGILDTMLVSERINSQRCLNQDLDTTKTIIDHKK